MNTHTVRVHLSAEPLADQDQLAWKIAQLAAARSEPDDQTIQMIVNRIIDNTAVAMASVNRDPVAAARAQALPHRASPGAGVYGLDRTVSPEWAAWANGVAVRELDFHDTYLAADYSHPADNIPSLLAVAQHCGRSGYDLAVGIAVAYEVQVALVRGICLHEHRIDHINHLGPSAAAGIGALLGLDARIIFQAVQQAVHCTLTTRQSRKGQISSWKAFAPAHAGKQAVEAIDRAMRGQGAPGPIYEGEDSLIAWVLNGRTARDQGKSVRDAGYEIVLPEPGEPCRAILETYTKEHSAEYQSQALIDLAIRMRRKIEDTAQIASIRILTSHHTHHVIGTGSGDPQKMDPTASRETLDHSVMYIFAVALQDGSWHHIDSYTPERAQRADTVRLWHSIKTEQDLVWTERYHHADPARRQFGATVEIRMKDGSMVRDELGVANAHPNGARPFARPEYVAKFRALSDGALDAGRADDFLESVQNLCRLDSAGLSALVPRLPLGVATMPSAAGIF